MKFIFISIVKFYKKFISPLFPPCCKYYPTCSTYALTAIERFGALRGTLLAIWRILRCNPWSMGGIDYVPEKFTFKVKSTITAVMISVINIMMNKTTKMRGIEIEFTL